MNVHHEGVLQIYAAVPLKSCVSQYSLILYEPYTESLSESLLKSETIAFKQLISYMIEIIKVLSYLKTIGIYPEI